MEKIKEQPGSRGGVKSFLVQTYPVLILIAMFLFFELLSHGKIHQMKYIKVIWESSFKLILGSLMAIFLYSMGEIDYSMGSTIGLAGIAAAYVSRVSIPLAFLSALAVGLCVGLLNGTIYAKFRIPVFFLTFCMSNVIAGLLRPLSKHTTVACDLAILKLNNNTLKIGVVLLAFAIIYILYKKTMFGKVCRAIGANETAVEQSGVKVLKYKILAFAVVGLACGIVAFFEIAKACGAGHDTGSMFHFNVLIALTLGGSSGAGAKIRLNSAVIGPLIVSILSCGMNIAGVSVHWQCIVKGALFLLVLFANHKLSNAYED